jgi:hypothetical protein
MELFVPSLAFLLVGVAVAFFVLPRLAPTILIGGSVVVLGVALYLHYSRFGTMEYERSTWQYNMKQYGSWAIVGAILLGAYGFYSLNNSGITASNGAVNAGISVPSPASLLAPAEPMPALGTPQMGGGFKNVFNTATARINNLMRHGRI